MGDEIETVAWPKNHDIFYKITASAIGFQMKTHGTAAIGLCSKLEKGCDYFVFLSFDQNRVWIRQANGRHSTPFLFMEQPPPPGLISATEFNKYRLSWYNNCIQLFKDGGTESVCKCSMDKEDLYYITFSNGDDGHPVYYKFTLPPPAMQPKFMPMTDGKVEWVLTEDQLPDGVLIGGHEDETLYIMRAEHEGSLTPGKFVPSEGTGYVPWGGNSNEKTNSFEVLCGYNCIWIQTHGDRIPVGAIEGGRSEVSDEKLYIGRAMHEGHLIPGKVQPTHRVCYIPYDGKEIAKSNYEILVDPNINSKCAHKFYKINTYMHNQGYFSDLDGDNYSSGEDDSED